MNVSRDEKQTGLRVVLATVLGVASSSFGLVPQPLFSAESSETEQQSATPAKTPPAVGTIKSISANTIVIANETGADIKVQLGPDVRFLRVPPGSRDLKEATPIQASDLQAGDRILVRGRPGDDPGTFVAATVISMKKADLDQKQAREREEWQRHGIGGIVKTVDAAAGLVTVGTMSASGKKDVEVHVGNATIIRRYAPGSVKFDDAKTSSLAEIHLGDQLRARGTRSEDGGSLSADEIVAGTFRNIAGMVASIDVNNGTIIVTDLSNNKAVEVKITQDSQVRKLPAPMAQRIAMRLRGTTPDGAATNGAGAKLETAPSGSAAVPSMGAAAQGGRAGTSGGTEGPGGQARNGGGGDLQQMLGRLPTSPLSDFQKGDAVVIVATSGMSDSKVVAITMLGGVEPILQASSQGQTASILSPWSLGSGGAGSDAGTP